jgi:NAD(P)H-dependent flavin oxidoreductase YrpB (nitropropane dioxygenase family)
MESNTHPFFRKQNSGHKSREAGAAQRATMAAVPVVPAMTVSTPITQMFGIQHPVLLAGMNVAAGPELAAAVTNAGGLGVIGGVGYTPKFLRRNIADLKKALNDPNAPFGVDLLLPQVGGGARKTNKDYTDGKLPELIDIVIESGARLFVSAVGVPPKWCVDKLHAAGIPVMNMVGAPKHVPKALAAGVDLICAQGGEGGGHTGDVPTSILIPACVDLCKGKKSPLTGKDVHVIAAGGIFDGRGLAMALALGAQAVWVGTRFICAKEAGAPPRHQQAVIEANVHDTVRTIIYTGRPLRVRMNPYVELWHGPRHDEIEELTSKGVIPAEHDMALAQQAASESDKKSGGGGNSESLNSAIGDARPLLMGQCAGVVNEILPAADIIRAMVDECVEILAQRNQQVVSVPVVKAKL